MFKCRNCPKLCSKPRNILFWYNKMILYFIEQINGWEDQYECWRLTTEGDLALPEIKTYYRITEVLSVWCWYSFCRQENEWNGRNKSKVYPHKGIIRNPWRKESLVNKLFWFNEVTIKGKIKMCQNRSQIYQKKPIQHSF